MSILISAYHIIHYMHTCTIRQAFFMKNQAEQGQKDWVRVVCRLVGSKSIYCPATDSQISSYMMYKVEEFYSSQEEHAECVHSPPKRAAVVTGLQPHLQQEKKIWAGAY